MPVKHDGLDAGIGVGLGEGLLRGPTRSAWPSALTGGLSMRMTATRPVSRVSTIATAHSPLLASDRLVPGPASSDPAWREATRRGYSSGNKAYQGGYAHAARVDDGPAAAGLERDRLRGRGLSRRRDRVADRGRRPAPLRLRPGARAHRPAGQRAGGARRQAGRPGGDAGLERLPPLRALLCHLRHRRGLPHHQPAPVPRADHLHRQPRRGHGAVLRSDLPAAGREAGARAQDHQDLRADDRPRAHAAPTAQMAGLLCYEGAAGAR